MLKISPIYRQFRQNEKAMRFFNIEYVHNETLIIFLMNLQSPPEPLPYKYTLRYLTCTIWTLTHENSILFQVLFFLFFQCLLKYFML